MSLKLPCALMALIPPELEIALPQWLWLGWTRLAWLRQRAQPVFNQVVLVSRSMISLRHFVHPRRPSHPPTFGSSPHLSAVFSQDMNFWVLRVLDSHDSKAHLALRSGLCPAVLVQHQDVPQLRVLGEQKAFPSAHIRGLLTNALELSCSASCRLLPRTLTIATLHGTVGKSMLVCSKRDINPHRVVCSAIAGKKQNTGS